MPSLTCFDVADYFLSLVDKESAESISNFRLQKLVYYAQGYHLAMYGKALFNEPIEAWDNGPIINVLLEKYKPFKSNPIDKPEKMDLSKFSEDVKQLLAAIIKKYGQFGPAKLRDITHEELPWINGFAKTDKIIADADLKQYFMTQIEGKQIK